MNTDQITLSALFTSKFKTSSRIVKWIMPLQEFTFSIEYTKGSHNIVADALSRIPWLVLPREPNAAERVCDADPDYEFELDAALTVLYVTMPTIDELPH